MSKRILDVNGDIIETLHYDEGTGQTVIQKSQDMKGYLDRNQKEREHQVGGWGGDLHKVASIPMTLVEEWCKEFGCNVLAKENRHLIMLKLNDRNYQKLRTKEGRV